MSQELYSVLVTLMLLSGITAMMSDRQKKRLQRAVYALGFAAALLVASTSIVST